VSLTRGSLEGIGWRFDFQTWRVEPKRRGLQKMLVYLFHLIPLDKEYVSEKELERLIGLLQWYAAGLPSGKSFLASLMVVKTAAAKKRGKRLGYRTRLNTISPGGGP